MVINNNPVLRTDQSHELCSWMTIDLTLLYNLSNLNAVWTFNSQLLQNLMAIYDSGTYQLSVTDLNGCSDSAIVIIGNIPCDCDVDFSYQGKCIKDPITFNVLADSTIMSLHWTIQHPSMPESNALSPVVIFPTAESFLVTLEATLLCGVSVIQKNIKPEDCADSCRVCIPSAFTPNNDGKNDNFYSYSECYPLENELEIWNRFGQMIVKSENISFT